MGSNDLDADLTWLLAGRDDSNRVEFAARHAWDPITCERSNIGFDDDSAALDRLTDLYAKAFPEGAPKYAQISRRAGDVRARFGEKFAARFAEAIEAEFDIDVIRISDVSTDYSLCVGGRAVIVLSAVPSWFRSKWSLAHKFAHLALDHHGSDAAPRLLKTLTDRVDPALPNSFAVAQRQQRAASRRLPVALVDALVGRTESGAIDPAELALVLDLGVDEVIESFAVPAPESEIQMAERMLAGPARADFGLEQLRGPKG